MIESGDYTGFSQVVVEDTTENTEQREVNFETLEKDFSKFIDGVVTTTENINGRINIDELNEIGEEIVKAKEYLTSFANGEKKSVREKAFNQLSNLPMIGGWAKSQLEGFEHQRAMDSSVKEVLDTMFDTFDVKKKRLIELTQIASDIRTQLLKQEVAIVQYIEDLEYVLETNNDPVVRIKALEMSIQAQTSEKIIKDQVYNKLNFILELMETLMVRMSKTLPAIRSQLLNETSIAGMITSISDSVKMMNSIQELTNEITQISTENIQELIVDVTNELTNGADIEFYKKSAQRNQKFHQTLIECETKRIKSNIDSFNALKEISQDTSLQLEQRVEAQMLALSPVGGIDE